MRMVRALHQSVLLYGKACSICSILPISFAIVRMLLLLRIIADTSAFRSFVSA